jgi:hypothetical protein
MIVTANASGAIKGGIPASIRNRLIIMDKSKLLSQ